jgi:tetratricopeptide (TPR) repeat protein
MGAQTLLEGADTLVFAVTGKHLNDLQRRILTAVARRRTYRDIAHRLGYTEGHIKDVAAHLWQTLSAGVNERVTKHNCWAVLERHLKSPPPASISVANPDPSPAAPPIPPPPVLLGREGAIAHLQTCVHQGHRCIVIQGEGGIGKTTLAQEFLTQQPFALRLELSMAKETANITPVEQVVEEWLRQDFQIEPGRDFGVTLGRLRRQLRDRSVGILIDNLEPALDGQGRFWPAHSRYGDLLRVLCDPLSQAVTLLTSRDRLCEPGLTVTHYRLPGLAPSVWGTFFQRQGVTCPPTRVASLHQAYGGNAKAMTILASAILTDFGGDGDAYWQENSGDPLVALDLKNLVASQVQRLQRLDPMAYQVFCRLGVFRYQDVPRISRAAIQALMADLDSDRHRQVIASLRNRSLLEGHRGSYGLHPVVQAEALAHLRQTPEVFTRAHRQAAQYWTTQITTLTHRSDATQALEAYYHYWAIADYAGAASVLLHSRPNQWGQHLPLGSSLYRLGLLQPVLTAIPPLLPQLPDDARASELRNILADVYWISGHIRGAIALQREAQAIAQRQLQCQGDAATPHQRYYLKMLLVDARLSLGLYHLDLGEIDTAAAHFEAVIAMAQHSAHQGWADKATLALALLNSGGSPQQQAQARCHAERVEQAIAAHQAPTGRFAFFIQMLGQIYSNLGDAERATQYYQRAIAFAQSGQYLQVEAKAQVGLGELARQRQDWATAHQHHTTALQHLQALGARSDLAEAYFQRGLTHQGQGLIEAAQADFAQAITHFEAIAAPAQIAKVQQAVAAG